VGTVVTACVGAARLAVPAPVQEGLTFALPLTVLLLLGGVQWRQRRHQAHVHQTLVELGEDIAALAREAALRRQVTAAEWVRLCRLRDAVQDPQHGSRVAATDPGGKRAAARAARRRAPSPQQNE
jgi:hypothetical protein